MKNTYAKNIIRTIKDSFGRYIAILAIIALGVGFFAGVKVTKASMLDTCDKYVSTCNMYDYKLISTLGYEKEDVERIEKLPGIREAERSITCDFFSRDKKGEPNILRAHSITKKINLLKVEEGRMAEASGECVGDSHYFKKEDLGTYVAVTPENSKDTRKLIKPEKMKLVGIADSVYYMSKSERGTSSLGNGKIDGYIYMPIEDFKQEYYTEVYATSQKQGYVYSQEYDENIEEEKVILEEEAEAIGDDRYDRVLSDAEAELKKGEDELEAGRRELQEGWSEYYRNRKEALSKLDSTKRTLDKNSKALEESEPALRAKKAEIEKQLASLEEGKKEAEEALQAANSGYEEALQSGDEEAIATAAEAKGRAEATLKEIEGGIASCRAGISTIDDNIDQLPAKRKQLEKGYREYEVGRKKALKSLEEARLQLIEGERELQEGEEELEKGREKIADIKEPVLYLELREDNAGYSAFDSNSDIVNSIAKVFPLFFFLIAALVCSTTMARMIEEERVQIGTLRALGYSKLSITMKYMIYSGSAAAIGAIGGFLLGSKLFPYAMWIAYSMIFGFAPLEFHFSTGLAIVSLLVALCCSVGTTLLACRDHMKEAPAQILRPKTPKEGKRVMLERIKPLWRRMKFLHKVSARNVFRYKKRMVMMIMGISGCAALVLAGFGIYDSVAGVADHQYEEVEKYQMVAQFKCETDREFAENFKEDYSGKISTFAPFDMVAVNVSSPKDTRSCSLMITDSPEEMMESINYREGTVDGPKISYPQKGEALINNKLAQLLDVDRGDTISVEYDDWKRVKLKVGGVYRNYVSNYLFIDSSTYTQMMGEKYSPEMAYISFTDNKDGKLGERRIRNIAEDVNGCKDLAGMELNIDTKKRVDDMMVSLNYIIWLVIGCAGALAFIVLFNLGNINITERKREIATIKVLGFYPKETGSYVFRENLILVIMGIIVGLPLGNLLHKFIMSQIIVDMIAFNPVLKPVSYFYSAVIVLLFMLFTDIIMRRKLRKISMTEALKSIE